MRLVRSAHAFALFTVVLLAPGPAGATGSEVPGLAPIPAPNTAQAAPGAALFHHVDPPADPNAAFDTAVPLSPDDAPHPAARRSHGALGLKAGESAVADADGDEAAKPVAWTIEDRRAAHRTHLLSMGIGAWPTALDAHLWYAVPLLRRGFIPRVNDAFHLEFGSLLSWDADGTVALWPAVGVRWDFYLTRRWATFFGLKLAAEVHLNQDQKVHPNAVVGFGALFRLAERALLRLELGYPQGLSVGLAVPIGPV